MVTPYLDTIQMTLCLNYCHLKKGQIYYWQTTKQDKIMSEYYQVKEIEGKGTGCVALKEIKPGIMILQEKPQLKLKCGNWSFRDLAIAFKQMV